MYSNTDEIEGEVELSPIDGVPFSYSSLSIELLGHITNKQKDYDFEFLHLTHEINNNACLEKTTVFSFIFNKLGFSYESYNGSTFIIEYLIRVIIIKKYIMTQQVQDKIINVIIPQKNCSGLLFLLKSNLDIEILYKKRISIALSLFKNKFHLKDVINGEIAFDKIDLPISSVDILLMKTEKFNSKIENIIITKYEICDGNPNIGDIFSFRICLENYDIGPTIENVNNYKCWVKYSICIVVNSKLDEDDYFYEDNKNDYGIESGFEKEFIKQQEIFIWRKDI